MSAKWMMFFTFCFLGGQIVSMVVDWETSMSSAKLGILNAILKPSILISNSTGDVNILTVLTLPFNIIAAFWNTLTWDYSFLQGDFIWARLFFSVFTVGFIWGAAQLIRGTGTK
jgi:hypothetical protein